MNPSRVPSAANTCEEPSERIGCSDASAGAGAGDVQDVADRRDRAEHERRREHAAADQEDPRGTRAVVAAPALASLAGHTPPRLPLGL